MCIRDSTGTERTEGSTPIFAPGRPQKRVQIGQLAALALISHPDFFLRVPAPWAVEEEKNIVAGALCSADILRVQLVDSRLSQLHERLVSGERFLIGVAKIGQ